MDVSPVVAVVFQGRLGLGCLQSGDGAVGEEAGVHGSSLHLPIVLSKASARWAQVECSSRKSETFLWVWAPTMVRRLLRKSTTHCGLLDSLEVASTIALRSLR